MQPVGEEESSNDLGLEVNRPCRSRSPRRAFHALGLLDRNVSSDGYSEEENWEEVNRAKLPPYFAHADYECRKKEQEHVPILICAMGKDHIPSLPPLHFYGRDCTEAFYDWLLTQTKVGDSRVLTVTFHNFKGCDGMSIFKHLYGNW